MSKGAGSAYVGILAPRTVSVVGGLGLTGPGQPFQVEAIQQISGMAAYKLVRENIRPTLGE